MSFRDPSRTRPYHVVIIPSAGRPEVLADTVASIARQLVPADEIILSVPDPADVRPDTAALPRVRVVQSPRGLTRQRNFGAERMSPMADVVSFFDDDVELAPDYLAWVQHLFTTDPSVALFSGLPIVDAVKDGGVSRDRALEIVAAHEPAPHEFIPAKDCYGCNMNVRAPVLAQVPFDERLPLYSWLEDNDFAARCARFGRVGRYFRCAFVHMGVASARMPGGRYGFAQVMNAYYLWRKGTLTGKYAASMCAKAVARNAAGAVVGDPRVDRRGRLRGNLVALGMIARNRVEPEYILTMR
jgi:glycosyltransferase involved in cell wall biosynthesis